MVKKLEPFYTTWEKERSKCKGQWQNKLMMCKAQGLSTDIWHKTGSDVSRKVTRASKTNQSERELQLWKMRPRLEWLNSQIQGLIPFWPELGPSQSTFSWYLHKLGLLNRLLRSSLWSDQHFNEHLNEHLQINFGIEF